MDDVKSSKNSLRAEAKRARGLLSLDSHQHDSLCSNVFNNINIDENIVVAAYWPKGRELDTSILIDECLKHGCKVSLPVIDTNSRVLKFANYNHDINLVSGQFDVLHPVIDDNTEFVNPDVIFVPMLAFDRRGYRLGYGGGYYDATLSHFRNEKEVIAVGLAYAKQACLFNLPTEDHDIKMDWIITEQSSQCYR